MEIQDLRRNYDQDTLDERSLNENPITQFLQWFEHAQATPAPPWLEINAMTLATSDLAGRVSARIVLLKTVDEQGFSFFTNYLSDKAQQLAVNPHAALVLYWPHLERQVRVEGSVTLTNSMTSDKYFHARPRGSQFSAIASPQSQTVPNRQQLELAKAELEARYAEGEVIPRPEYWGGYLLAPDRMEFWQGRPNRLHDRFLYLRIDPHNSAWKLMRLAP